MKLNKNNKVCYILCRFLWQTFIHVILPEENWTFPETLQKGQQNAVLLFSNFSSGSSMYKGYFCDGTFFLHEVRKYWNFQHIKNTSLSTLLLLVSWNMEEFYSTWILHLLITLFSHNSDSKISTQRLPFIVALTVSVPYLSYITILPQKKQISFYLNLLHCKIIFPSFINVWPPKWYFKPNQIILQEWNKTR